MAAGLLAAILPAAIQGVTGLFGSIFNTSSQSSTNAKNLAWQTEQNAMNRQFNADEAEKQRQWQSGEWMNQFNLQRDEWYRQQAAQFDYQKRMFDYQAAYNDPSAQLKRLQGAGLNSAALLGDQGSSGLVAASTANFGSAPSPSVPSGGAVSGSAASATPVGSPNLQAPQFDLGGLGNFLSQSAKAWAENKSLGPTIEGLYADIAKKRAETANVEVLTSLNDVDLFVRNATKDTKVRQESLNLALTIADIDLKKAQGRNYDADAVFKQAESLLSASRKKLSDEQYVQLEFVTAHMLETWTNEQNALKAQAKQANAAAFESFQSGKLKIEQAATERDIRQWQVANVKAISEYNFYLKESQKVDSAINVQSANERLMYLRTTLVNEAFKSHLINEATKHQIDLLIAQREFYAVDEFIKALGAISGLGMAAGVGVGAMSKFQSKPVGPLGPIYPANTSFSY